MSRLSRPHLTPALAALLTGLSLAVAGCGDDNAAEVDTTTPASANKTDPALDANDPITPAPKGQPGKPIKAIDGDTFEIEVGGKTERVRLLGIDSPEATTKRTGKVECGADFATGAARRLVEKYKDVEVSRDPSQPERDQYDRLLAYVVPTNGDPSWNTRLLRAGWADLNVRKGQKLVLGKDFRAAAKKAEDVGAGVYSMCEGFGQPE